MRSEPRSKTQSLFITRSARVTKPVSVNYLLLPAENEVIKT